MKMDLWIINLYVFAGPYTPASVKFIQFQLNILLNAPSKQGCLNLVALK